MKSIQTNQTISDIARLYKSDIGDVEKALDAYLMKERQSQKGSFKNLPRKHQLADLNLNQRWWLHLSLFFDWIHYRTRCCASPLIRTIKRSKLLLNNKNSVIQEIEGYLKNGVSLKYRVSRDILRKLKSKNVRSDPLLWHWNIHHFHLGPHDQQLGYAIGTENLLFAYVDHNRAILLGIGTHADFSSSWVIDTLIEAAPELCPTLFSGPIPERANCFTDEEKRQLWNSGATTTHEFKGRLYYPVGGGIASSDHGDRLINIAGKVLRNISEYDKKNFLCVANYQPIHMKFNSISLELWHGTSNNFPHKPFWCSKPLV